MDELPGADRQPIDMFVQDLDGQSIPEDYLDLMRYSNGMVGCPGEEAYLLLHRLDELPKINAAACVNELAPGMLIFGSDGGGMTYAFDTRSEPAKIVEVPSEILGWDEVWTTWDDFEAFITDLSRRT